MTATRSRLGSVYAKLTARERAVTTLEAHKAEREPDPRLLSTMPPEQGPEYNRYADRLERFDRAGRALLLALARGIDTCETLTGWLATVRLVGGCLDALEAEAELHRDERARPPDRLQAALEKLQRRIACCAFPDEDGASDTEEPRSLIPILRDRFRREVQDRWAELRAVEIEADDLGATLDCPDVLMPDLRSLLDDCRGRLQALAAEPRYLGEPIALAEPEGEYLALVEEVFRPGH